MWAKLKDKTSFSSPSSPSLPSLPSLPSKSEIKASISEIKESLPSKSEIKDSIKGAMSTASDSISTLKTELPALPKKIKSLSREHLTFNKSSENDSSPVVNEKKEAFFFDIAKKEIDTVLVQNTFHLSNDKGNYRYDTLNPGGNHAFGYIPAEVIGFTIPEDIQDLIDHAYDFFSSDIFEKIYNFADNLKLIYKHNSEAQLHVDAILKNEELLNDERVAEKIISYLKESETSEKTVNIEETVNINELTVGSNSLNFHYDTSSLPKPLNADDSDVESNSLNFHYDISSLPKPLNAIDSNDCKLNITTTLTDENTNNENQMPPERLLSPPQSVNATPNKTPFYSPPKHVPIIPTGLNIQETKTRKPELNIQETETREPELNNMQPQKDPFLAKLECILKTYQNERQKESDYKSSFFCIPLGYSKTEKLDAVRALLSALNDGEVHGLRAHLSALRNGELGKRIREYVKTTDTSSFLKGDDVNTVTDLVNSLEARASVRNNYF